MSYQVRQTVAEVRPPRSPPLTDAHCGDARKNTTSFHRRSPARDSRRACASRARCTAHAQAVIGDVRRRTGCDIKANSRTSSEYESSESGEAASSKRRACVVSAKEFVPFTTHLSGWSFSQLFSESRGGQDEEVNASSSVLLCVHVQILIHGSTTCYVA